MRISSTMLVVRIKVAVLACTVFAGCATTDRATQLRNDVARRLGAARPAETRATHASAIAAPLTLETATQLAWQSATARAALARMDSEQGAARHARAWPNPHIEGEIRWHDGEPHYGLGASLALLPLVTRGSITRAADARHAVAQARAAMTLVELATKAQQAFVGVQVEQQLLAIERTAEAVQAAAAETAAALLASGNITELERVTYAANAAEAAARRAAREASWRAAREQLNDALGLTGPETAWVIEAQLVAPPADPTAAADDERAAIAASLALASARAAAAAASADVANANVLGILSDMRVGVHAETEDGAWTVGPTVSLALPLFDQGQGLRAQTNGAFRATMAEVDALAVSIRARVRAAHAEREAADAQVALYRDQVVPLRRAAVAETLRQYNAMMMSVFDLLTARAAEVAAEQAAVVALGRAWQAHLQLAALRAGHAGSAPTMNVPEAVSSPGSSGGHHR